MMDEDRQEDVTIDSLHSRYRSPSFAKEEVKALVNLIEKYKNILMNKSTTNTVLHAKEVIWAKLTKLFNSQGFKHSRSTESLKMKWDNLKREARKASKNLIDVEHENFDELICHIVTMMNDSETNEIFDAKDYSTVVECDDLKESKKISSIILEETNEEGVSEAQIRYRRNRSSRSSNFTPQECSTLIKCVRAEKHYVFSKVNTARTVKMKARAWQRITHAFNKLSTHKRSTKMLQNKFANMKKLARRQKRSVLQNGSDVNYVKIEDDADVKAIKHDAGNEKIIKLEPSFDSNDETDHEGEGVDNMVDDHIDSGSDTQTDRDYDHPLDPLSTVLNSDSGLGFTNNDSFGFSENKEIVKLQTELLKYQLENAKLERKRIEDAIRMESEANQARSTETALRLRAARLEAVAAAMKILPGHPALMFTPEESCAQQYLNQYES